MLYVAEITRLVEDFEAIGCTADEVEALIVPALDTLRVDGELAEQIVADMRNAIEHDGLFSDL